MGVDLEGSGSHYRGEGCAEMIVTTWNKLDAFGTNAVGLKSKISTERKHKPKALYSSKQGRRNINFNEGPGHVWDIFGGTISPHVIRILLVIDRRICGDKPKVSCRIMKLIEKKKAHVPPNH